MFSTRKQPTRSSDMERILLSAGYSSSSSDDDDSEEESTSPTSATTSQKMYQTPTAAPDLPTTPTPAAINMLEIVKKEKQKAEQKANEISTKEHKGPPVIDGQTTDTGSDGSNESRKETPDQASASTAGAIPSKAMTPEQRALMEKQVKQKKEKFLMFTRVLMKYLEQKDVNMHERAKAVIKDCAEKNKNREAGYQSLTASMSTRLRATVGDTYWRRAEDYLNHFLKQKLMQQEAARKEKAQKAAAAVAAAGIGSSTTAPGATAVPSAVGSAVYDGAVPSNANLTPAQILARDREAARLKIAEIEQRKSEELKKLREAKIAELERQRLERNTVISSTQSSWINPSPPLVSGNKRKRSGIAARASRRARTRQEGGMSDADKKMADDYIIANLHVLLPMFE